ncbi:MAG: helix-turn-helix domain-containing protein [Bacteroidales bacterium]
MNQPEFGNKLAEIRKAKGLTQSELAEKCDVSYRTIQRIETGKVTPRGFTIKTLSAALDFDFLKVFSDNSSKVEDTDSQRFITVQKIIEQVIDLFNLKTNAMKKLSILTVIFGLIGLGLFTVTNKVVAQGNSKFIDFGVMDTISEITKKEAIREIKMIKRKARFHTECIDIIKTYAEKSNTNYDTYLLLSKLVASFGHSTKYLMEIANVVFLTHKDCDLFNEIAPLIFLNNKGSSIYVDGKDVYQELAKKASNARTQDEKDDIMDMIFKIREHGEFKTLKEAFNDQKEI